MAPISLAPFHSNFHEIFKFCREAYSKIQVVPSERAPSKILNRLSKTMHSAASPRKKERLSPSPCMHTASIWGEGTFCLDREFSENAQYKQKIIFHLASSDKMSQKRFFFAWTVDRWYFTSGGFP